MSHHTNEVLEYRIPASSMWANLWKVMAVLSGVGVLGAVFGYLGDAERFAYSYLFAFAAVLSIALGALFFVLIQHLTGAGWSVTVRRTAEFLLSGLVISPLLFVPVYLSASKLYPWLHHEGAQTHAEAHVGSEHVAPAHGHQEIQHHDSTAHQKPNSAPVMSAAEHHAHQEIVAKKSPYLNLGFFTARAAVYFLIWLFLAHWFFKTSTLQDKSKDVALTAKMERFAPLATFATALTLTFAVFDWVMSLDPAWYSTIFGVYYFACSLVSVLALILLITLGLAKSGLVGDSIRTVHHHDLGKLLFGFLVFWAYIGFSQLLLIWYASIPEETTYYHTRWDVHGWKMISLAIVLAKFVVPFFFLLSRNIKRQAFLLGFGSAWLLVMHLVDMYWFVLPNYQAGRFSPHMLDVACVLAVAGAYLAVVFYRMQKHSLIPVGDPRLNRALHFEGV